MNLTSRLKFVDTETISDEPKHFW